MWARALRACKTLTPRLTDFLSTDFEKKPTVLQSNQDAQKVSFTAYQRESKEQNLPLQVQNPLALAIGHDFLCTQCDYKEHDLHFFLRGNKQDNRTRRTSQLLNSWPTNCIYPASWNLSNSPVSKTQHITMVCIEGESSFRTRVYM